MGGIDPLAFDQAGRKRQGHFRIIGVPAKRAPTGVQEFFYAAMLGHDFRVGLEFQIGAEDVAAGHAKQAANTLVFEG